MTSLEYPATPLAAVRLYFYILKEINKMFFLLNYFWQELTHLLQLTIAWAIIKNDPLMLLEANFIAGRAYWCHGPLYLDDWFLS